MKQLNFDLVPHNTPIKFSEHFCSLEGEGDAIGHPSLYLRLAGCYSAACAFCDTKFSWGVSSNSMELGSKELSKALVKNMREAKPRRLTITGGEPLHYMEHFSEIYSWADSLSGSKISYLGIESNGNLLAQKEHAFTLIKSFNNLHQNFNIIPTLTISPKLDATSCYEDQLTQEDVDLMYFEAFQNINDYMYNFPVRYKFIYDCTGINVNTEHLMIFINFLIEELNVDREHIMLMPFTPENPLKEDKVFWEQSKDLTAKKALELGIKYSPRIHIDRKLD